MSLPSPDTPLYNHPLPDIEQWLISQGCEPKEGDRHCWMVHRPDWQAEICMDIDSLKVRYIGAAPGNQDILRSFKYSLSRQDLSEAIFEGP